MILDLENKFDIKKATERLDWCLSKKKRIELKVIGKKRSLKQNSYLHLMLTFFACNLGYTLEESKLIYKQINKDIYEYEKKGRLFYRSTAKMTTKQIEQGNERFRIKVMENSGLYIPLPNEQHYETWIKETKNLESSNRAFL